MPLGLLAGLGLLPGTPTTTSLIVNAVVTPTLPSVPSLPLVPEGAATSTLSSASAPLPVPTSTNTSSPCLDSTVTELQINSILNHGGPGTTVYLCPSAVILISNPILFTAVNQTIMTLGMPFDDTRATIRVVCHSVHYFFLLH